MRQFLDRLPLVLQAKAEPGALAAATDGGTTSSNAREAGGAQRAGGAAGRRHAPSSAHLDALSLDVERSREDISDRAVPARVRPGRPLRPGLRAGVRPAAHVRRGSDSRLVADRGAVRAGRRRRKKRSRTRSASIRARRRRRSRSRSRRGSRATSRNARGTHRSRPRINRTAACTWCCTSRTTGRFAAGCSASDRSRGCCQPPELAAQSEGRAGASESWIRVKRLHSERRRGVEATLVSDPSFLRPFVLPTGSCSRSLSNSTSTPTSPGTRSSRARRRRRRCRRRSRTSP